MALPTPVLQRQSFDSLPAEQWRAVCVLFDRVWPSAEGPLAEQAEAYRADKLGQQREVVTVRAGEELVAVAIVFPREIRTATGAMTVMALAGVCTAPEWRGRGWGAAVVRAAFSPVDEGRFGVALFQTPVADFYAKLGARPVDNVFVNSRWRPGDRHSAEAPWWDPSVMIYPAGARWPEGVIDLLGPGY